MNTQNESNPFTFQSDKTSLHASWSLKDFRRCHGQANLQGTDAWALEVDTTIDAILDWYNDQRDLFRKLRNNYPQEKYFLSEALRNIHDHAEYGSISLVREEDYIEFSIISYAKAKTEYQAKKFCDGLSFSKNMEENLSSEIGNGRNFGMGTQITIDTALSFTPPLHIEKIRIGKIIMIKYFGYTIKATRT